MPGRAAFAAEITSLARRMDAKAPQIAAAIGKEIFAEIPGYSALKDPSARAEVEEAATRNVRAFMRALSEGRELAKRDIEALGEVGAERAGQGIPIEDVLKAFRTVGRVLWDHISAELVGPSGPPVEVAIAVSGILMRFTDQISSAVARHYSVAQRSIVRRQEAARREFLHDLLMGSYASPEDMLQRARSYGYDLAKSHLGIVAGDGGSDSAAGELALSRALDRVAERFRITDQPVVDHRGGQAVALVGMSSGSAVEPDAFGAALVEELGDGWQVGLGGPYSGLEGCRRSFGEAREALEIGSLLEPEGRFFSFANFLLYGFLRSDPALVDRFVEAVLGPLIEHDSRRRSDLVGTLDAYLTAGGSAKEAGRLLYAHPHTVTYRLKQIERLAARSLRDPEDRLHLHLAIKALRLSKRASSQGPGLRSTG